MHNILWVFSSTAERPFAMLKGKTGSPCLLWVGVQIYRYA